MQKLIAVMGIVLVAVAVVWGVVVLFQESAMARTVKIYSQPNESQIQVVIPVTGTPTSTPETEKALILTATPTVRTVFGYEFDNKIDLSSGAPVALAIELPNGSLLQTNWASAVAYNGTDDVETASAPDKGVIYSYESDVTASWTHSGTTTWGQTYFATNIDLYLRKDENNATLSMPEALQKADGLKGSVAYLCQVDSGVVKPLSNYESPECPGKLVELEIVAATIVPHEMLAEYKLETTVVAYDQWLSTNFPDSGFDQLKKTDSWIISFCVGKLAGQESDGTPSYLYNRGVIGFRIKDGSS